MGTKGQVRVDGVVLGRGGGLQAGCERSAARVVSEMDEGSCRSCSRVWRVEKCRRRRDGRDDGCGE